VNICLLIATINGSHCVALLGRIVDSGLEGMLKERNWAKYEILSQYLPEGTGENHDELQDSRFSSRDLSPGSAECEGRERLSYLSLKDGSNRLH
jgi:hypothetical protein